MASPFAPAVMLRGEQTGGAISVMQNAVPARWDGPPLHHHEFDETFYVLDGELTFQVRDELFTAGPGALAFAPGGVVHTFANLGDAPARYLLLCTPAGFEGYFAGLAVMENRIPAGAAGSSQRSYDVDELFWVLDGELTLQLGAERIVRRAGEVAFAPHGADRAFANHGDDEARTLIVCTPTRS
jgi:quercetin dioxygenase-like cupin family protein